MPKRLAIFADYPEEHWPSMDLVANMLTCELQSDSSLGLAGERMCPAFRRRATSISRSRIAQNADRLLNRIRDYPRFAARQQDRFDLFHVCDHSYSQIVHSLPAERTGVFCHDLDTFRCILAPQLEPRPRWFRAMTRRILRGLQDAAIVFHATREVRRQIEQHALLDPVKLVHAPLGVSPTFFRAEETRDADPPFVLHVGSCIARKRIDVLLNVFGRLAATDSELRLIQVGGEWTSAQEKLVDSLGIGRRVTQQRDLPQPALAKLYRSARLVLLPSEAEGFGLPLAEALASGATVIASDIPVLREVGGDVTIFCPVGNLDEWTSKASALLFDAPYDQRRRRKQHASQFTWQAHVRIIAQAYRRLGDA